MLKILLASSDPCFQCGSKNKTVLVKGNNFHLVLCWEHLWPHVPAVPRSATTPEPTVASGQRRETSS